MSLYNLLGVQDSFPNVLYFVCVFNVGTSYCSISNGSFYVLFYRFGIYPLTCFELPEPAVPPRPQASSPEVVDSVKSCSPEPIDTESRRVINMMCNVKPNDVKPKEDTTTGLIVLILISFPIFMTNIYFSPLIE